MMSGLSDGKIGLCILVLEAVYIFVTKSDLTYFLCTVSLMLKKRRLDVKYILFIRLIHLFGRCIMVYFT